LTSPDPRRRTRALQIGFLALLAFSTAQVVWWVYDQSRLAGERRRSTEELYQTEAQLARELLKEGTGWETIARRLPDIERVDGEVRISPESLTEIREERLRRLRRYGWEGSFFLAVLVACMAVIWRTLHEEAELARRQENFLASVSHELKSPLASLQLSVDTIRLRRPGPERLTELLDRMTIDLARLETLVSEVLDTAKLESGQRPLKRQAVQLAEEVGEAVAALAERAQATHVDLAVDVDPELAVAADPVAVRTVLRNLLDNALRATATAGGGQIRVAASAAGDLVRVTVADTGVGFPPEEASKLFQKFYRIGDELRRSTPGTGLGLYIVSRLVELQQGTVAARSAGPGQGATFTVVWPRHAAEATA